MATERKIIRGELGIPIYEDDGSLALGEGGMSLEEFRSLAPQRAWLRGKDVRCLCGGTDFFLRNTENLILRKCRTCQDISYGVRP